MVIDDKLTTGHVRPLISIEDADTQIAIAEKIFDEKLSVRDAEKLVKDGLQESMLHRVPEKYYDGVMKGACLVADECTKDIIFE